MPNQRVKKERDYKFRRGTTAWKKEDIRKLIIDKNVSLIVRWTYHDCFVSGIPD
jgi:20S proteasome subunit beta 2